MMRLSLSPAKVLHSLGNLHALDGLAGEAALYYVQYAEHMVRSSAPAEAANALRQAFDVCQDNVRVLEQLAEAWLLAGEKEKAAEALVEASTYYRQRAADLEARRCLEKASTLDPSIAAPEAAPEPVVEMAVPAPTRPAMLETPAVITHDVQPEILEPTPPGLESEPVEPPAPELPSVQAPQLDSSDARHVARPAAPAVDGPDRMSGFETGRHDTPKPPAARAPARVAPPAPVEEVAAELPEPEPVAAEPEPVEPEFVEESGPAIVEVVGESAEPAEAPDEEPVYEIGEDELAPLEAVSAEDSGTDESVYEIADDALEAEPSATPGAPGLAFGAPVAAAPSPEEGALLDVEALLGRAQEQFRAGDRDEASHTLIAGRAGLRGAAARLESAATIYRSLGRGAHATPEMLELWLANCERRRDTHEGGTGGVRPRRPRAQRRRRVGRARLVRACARARRRQRDRPAPAAASRHLRRDRAPPVLAAPRAVPAPAPPPAPVHAEAPVAAAPPEQRVEVAVGRAEAVSFDLAGLLAEFQRGVESQLAGDAQSHYDLGMTYREMGLLEQAMESFRAAGRIRRSRRVRAEMVGALPRRTQGARRGGRASSRARWRCRASRPENDAELRFHFGSALVELGASQEALERVRARGAQHARLRGRR